MSRQSVTLIGVLIGLGVISLTFRYGERDAAAAMAATFGEQTATGTPLRTPWGDPDLQGIWSSGYILTPLERPERFANKEFVTEEEAAALEKEALARFDHSVGGKRLEARPGDPGTYNSAFTGAGREVIRTRRTSQIVDPPDGRIPWASDARKRLAAEADVSSSERGRFREDNDLLGDGPEDRPNDRCMGVSIPLRFSSAGAAGALHRIVQTPGHIAIYYEHGHQGGAYRSIALGRPHLPSQIRQYLGDPQGRWENNTLVVDTTNFTHQTNYEGSRDNLHLVERFTRIEPAVIMYRVTIEDPTVFTRPWTLEIPLIKQDDKANRIYESACQEGNYALTSILAAARLQEKEMTATKVQEKKATKNAGSK